MTTAARKPKIADTMPLLQKGDRITGKTAKGTQYTGSFEGYTTDEWIRCNPGHGLHTGEKTIALNPASVERVAEPELEAIPEAWQPQEGDRVRGITLVGEQGKGVITQLGKKYAVLNNQPNRSLTLTSVELLQAQAIPQDLLHLVGLEWSEQVDRVFGELGIANLGNFIGAAPDLTPFESWRGWEISFHQSTEVHLSKRACEGYAWFITLGKAMSLKSNGDISKFCRKAIDQAEDAIATVEAGMSGQESTVSGQPALKTQHFQPADTSFAQASQRIRITHSDTPADIDRVGTVQPPWDSQQQAAEYLKVLLDGDEICRAFKPEQVELCLPAPMQSLGALLPSVEASIVTHAEAETASGRSRLETLAAEVEAIFAEAEEAEATMLNAGRAAFTRSLALGEKLLAAKAEAEIGGYGKWLPWLEQRGIPERKAQRAIRLHSHRQLLEQSVTATELTLTEALELVSKKSLKPAVETSIALQTPDAIEEQYALTGDHATPTLEEMMILYSQLGAVKPWRKGFAVERDIGAPFPLAFQNRASAWRRWQQEWRSFALSHPLPATATPLDNLPIIPPETSALEGENQGIDASPYEYTPIAPKPCWFNPGGGVVEGQAIATNQRGMIRIVWGEDQESSVPDGRVSWLEPKQLGSDHPQTLQPNGLVSGDRPTGSQWLPEEAANVARIQLQGLLKHLEPKELVKAAIVYSGVPLVDAVRVAVEMANSNEVNEIHELAQKKALETL